MVGSEKARKANCHVSIVRANKWRVNVTFVSVTLRVLNEPGCLVGTIFSQTVYNLCNAVSPERLLDETSLIRSAANGDAMAWEPLMLAHQQAVFRLSYLLLGDPDDAEDIAQETFVRAWKHLKGFDAARPLRPWLLSIASNLASNRRRSAGRYVAALMRVFRDEPRHVTIEEKSAQNFEASDLWKSVQHLNLPEQQIIYLRFFLDLSVAETAETLQIAEGTVKSRLSRALEKLRAVTPNDFEGHAS